MYFQQEIDPSAVVRADTGTLAQHKVRIPKVEEFLLDHRPTLVNEWVIPDHLLTFTY